MVVWPKTIRNYKSSTREEIDLYESASDSDVEFHDFEDDIEDIVGTSTVKISDRRAQESQPASTGWQANTPLRAPSPSKSTIVPRSPSPSKPIAYARTGSQVTTPSTITLCRFRDFGCTCEKFSYIIYCCHSHKSVYSSIRNEASSISSQAKEVRCSRRYSSSRSG